MYSNLPRFKDLRFKKGFKLEDHALDVRLTDASEDGGLFGFRFD